LSTSFQKAGKAFDCEHASQSGLGLNSYLVQDVAENAEPFPVERLPAYGLTRPAIPVGSVALIAFLAVEIRVNPRSLDAFVLLRGVVRLFPVALASHHSPTRACVSPAGGSVAVRDWRNSFKVILG
jgi:hypothetical protein